MREIRLSGLMRGTRVIPGPYSTDVCGYRRNRPTQLRRQSWRTARGEQGHKPMHRLTEFLRECEDSQFSIVWHGLTIARRVILAATVSFRRLHFAASSPCSPGDCCCPPRRCSEYWSSYSCCSVSRRATRCKPRLVSAPTRQRSRDCGPTCDWRICCGAIRKRCRRRESGCLKGDGACSAQVSVVRYPISDVVVRPISDIAVRLVSTSRLSAVVLLPEQIDERLRAECEREWNSQHDWSSRASHGGVDGEREQGELSL